MTDTTIKLVKKTYTTNDIGTPIQTEVISEVLANVRSVGRADFYAGSQVGLAMSYVFETHPCNYDGEDTLEYDGERYGIVRTYQTSEDVLEIYTGEKVGQNVRPNQGS